MSDVFISYSRQNSDFAHKLIERLNLANKDAWVDWEGIPQSAPNWWVEIEDYSHAIELEPLLTKAYLNRGIAYYIQSDRTIIEKIELALADFSTVIEQGMLKPTG